MLATVDERWQKGQPHTEPQSAGRAEEALTLLCACTCLCAGALERLQAEQRGLQAQCQLIVVQSRCAAAVADEGEGQ